MATRRRVQGHYDRDTLALFAHAWKINRSPKILLRYAMFRRDLGFTIPQRWVEDFLKVISNFGTRNRWLVLALIAEIRPERLATIPDTWTKGAGLPVLEALNSQEKIQKECCLAEIYLQQEKWRNEFYEWLKSCRSKGVCVVGNSASLRGSGQGSIIDRYAAVIRFNRFESEDTSSFDLGSRIDVWVVSPDYKGHVPDNIRWIVVTGPDMLFRLRNWQFIKIFLDAGKPVLTVPLVVWQKMVSSLEAPPSAGILVLGWINNLLESWDGVTSAGIGTGLTKKGAYHITDCRHRAVSRHHWLREKDLIRDWQAEGLNIIPICKST